MLLLCLRTTTYLSSQLLVYLPIAVPVHDPTWFFSFWLTVKIYPSTFPLFYMSTDVSVHQYTCSVYFLFFNITCTMTFQLFYWGTYTQIQLKIYLPVYLHAFISCKHKDLPVTTTCVHEHRCTHSWPYLFILSFWLTVYIYLSTFLLLYMYTDTPVHQYTCSVYFFIFGITCTVTFPLICWGMYTQILMLLLCLGTKDLPVTTTTCVPGLKCTRSWPCLFIFIL